MAGKSKDQEFVEFIVKALVDHPDDVKVTRAVDEMGVLISLKINPEDMGQVIGRQGQTARSIRSLLRIVGIKNNARVNLKIEEPEGGRRAPSRVPARGGRPSATSSVDELKL
jgi:predicted RNA-binding protein YlqC (UPF0109 family)